MTAIRSGSSFTVGIRVQCGRCEIKDGTFRFCVDYRQLNERTVKDGYPLPRIDGCLDFLRGARWFSTMDLRSGYHQVAMDEEDKNKTTFVTKRALLLSR